VAFVVHESHLEAVITGLASPEGAGAVLARVGEEAARRGARRVLLDCLQILGQTAPYDHQQIGLALARHLRGVRCALVTARSKLQGVMSEAARGAGADYQAFDNLADARVWLCL
jgi:hypothetical protein